VAAGLSGVASRLPDAARLAVSILRWPLLAVLLIAGLAVLYRYAADRDDPRWTWVSWGSGVATLLWILASIGFSVYASSFGNYNKTYGALAGVVILLFWMFLSAFVVLVDAELNAEMELQTAKDTTSGPEKPMGILMQEPTHTVAARSFLLGQPKARCSAVPIDGSSSQTPLNRVAEAPTAGHSGVMAAVRLGLKRQLLSPL
jgi:Virulence factor BrkB